MNPSSSSSPANCSRSLTVSSLLISSPEILFWKKYFWKCVYIIQTKEIPKSILRWSFTKIRSFLKGSMYKSYPSKYLDLRISNSSQMSTFNVKHFWCNEFLAFFWKCWKLCYSISEKCWKFITSKILEIKSQHLTWVGPYA